MQRHGQDEVGIGDEVAPGLRHHPAQCERQLDAIAIFQAMDQLARRAVEAADGPRPGEDRRIGDRRGREQAGAEIDGKRRAEALAIRPLDEADATPASRAQGLGLTGRGLAGDAGRRVDDADQSAQAGSEGLARACSDRPEERSGRSRDPGCAGNGQGAPRAERGLVFRHVDPPLRHGEPLSDRRKRPG